MNTKQAVCPFIQGTYLTNCTIYKMLYLNLNITGYLRGLDNS